MRFFDNPPAPLDQIEPVHIRQYMDWRVQKSKAIVLKKNKPITPTTGQVRANREKSLFSHIWNFAREYGYTKHPNPCLGVHSFKEKGRDIYVKDDTFFNVLEHSVAPLQFAMRLAYLTGQRPADVLKINMADIQDGYIHFKQNKTDGKLRIAIEGGLEALLNEIQTYKASIKSKIIHRALLVNSAGKPFTKVMLNYHFSKARDAAGIAYNDFQFKDLRAKAATDTDDQTGIRNAQALLGHSTEKMTAHYVRNRQGKKVSPVELRKCSAKNKTG